MSGDALIEALELPTDSRVIHRVPKKLLLENVSHTAADKRLVSEGMEELYWLAVLKPSTIGVPVHCDAVREYLEIVFLRLTLRAAVKSARLVELVHRAVPYPLLLLTEQADGSAPLALSAAHKRWSQGEADKTVLEGELVAAEWDAAPDGQRWPGFREALALGKQPRMSLYTLYQGWIDVLLALQAARMTGVFALAADAERAAARRDALRECARLDGEIAHLRVAAAKEKQISRRVDLNLELKRVEAAQAAARANL